MRETPSNPTSPKARNFAEIFQSTASKMLVPWMQEWYGDSRRHWRVFSIVQNPTRLGMIKVTVEGRGVASTKTIGDHCMNCNTVHPSTLWWDLSLTSFNSTVTHLPILGSHLNFCISLRKQSLPLGWPCATNIAAKVPMCCGLNALNTQRNQSWWSVAWGCQPYKTNPFTMQDHSYLGFGSFNLFINDSHFA